MERVRTGEILLDNNEYFVELTVSRYGKYGAIIREKKSVTTKLLEMTYTYYIPEEFCKISCKEKGIKVYTFFHHSFVVGLYSYQGKKIIPTKYDFIYMFDKGIFAKDYSSDMYDIYLYSGKKIVSLKFNPCYPSPIKFLEKGIQVEGYENGRSTFGFYGYNGNTIVPIEEGYSELRYLETRIEAEVFDPQKEGLKYAWYSYDGKIIIPIHDEIEQIGNLIIAQNYFFHNLWGKLEKFPYRDCKFKMELQEKRRLSAVLLDIEYHLFSVSGKKIATNSFHDLKVRHEVIIVGTLNKQSFFGPIQPRPLYAAYSKDGKEIIPLGNHQIRVFPDGILVIGGDNPGFYEFKNLCM